MILSNNPPTKKFFIKTVLQRKYQHCLGYLKRNKLRLQRPTEKIQLNLDENTQQSDGILVELFQILNDDAVKVLHSIYQQIWKTHPWPQDWKRSAVISIPKKDNAKECSNYRTIALISHASKVMFKILQARLQQYLNQEFPDFQAGFRKGRETRDQIANILFDHRKSKWIPEKHLLLLYWLHQNLWLCGSQQTVENS